MEKNCRHFGCDTSLKIIKPCFNISCSKKKIKKTVSHDMRQAKNKGMADTFNTRKIIYLNCGGLDWSSQLSTQLMQLRNLSLKNIYARTGFEPITGSLLSDVSLPLQSLSLTYTTDSTWLATATSKWPALLLSMTISPASRLRVRGAHDW